MDDSVVARMRENRSFVIRQVRMSPHQKDAYQRLFPRYAVTGPDGSDVPQRFSWEESFHRTGAENVLDIGFGMGYELAELAQRHPEKNYLGVEVHKPGVGRLLGEIETRQLENVRVIRHDAVPVCAHLIPHGSVDAVHLFFPDPWPKKRHHKRRLVRPAFPDLIAPIIRQRGYFYAATDWEDYAEQILAVMTESRLFRNRFDRFAPRQGWRPETAFERKGLAKGHTIFEIIFERQ
jgi:tRNA (guanine-N7-)-methyltransferase